ncbi:MAG: MFS transporter [Planctomycetota bacterium]|nr:MAG: MFS transporter [Planctomycetota bacterium]
MTRYHWFVLLVAALGWLFDCLDQQLFVLARPAAMRDLLPPQASPEAFEQTARIYGGYATSIFLAGWALGGVFFGVLGDRWGRAKVMMITILMYSAFTGLSSLSRGFWDFALYRFLTGLGVGGEFAVGVALVAEVMPATARPRALALLQALSAVGNISAAFINLGLGVAQEQGLVHSPWRVMFLIGAVPALLAVVIRRRLKEPERWQRASHDDAARKTLGSYRELFRDPTTRKHALLGLVLACAGVIGLWGVGFFTPDLIRTVQTPIIKQRVIKELLDDAQQEQNSARAAALEQMLGSSGQAASPGQLDAAAVEEVNRITNGRAARWASYTSLMINVGAFLGMFGFGALAERLGRKQSFVIALVAAFLSTAAVFRFLNEFWEIFILVPIMGFCQLSLFAGYAIYFPELFPTHLRSTGTSFCYNVGRFVAAAGPLIQAKLIERFAGTENSLREAGFVMSGIFLVGLLALPFLPETKGRPLPD